MKKGKTLKVTCLFTHLFRTSSGTWSWGCKVIWLMQKHGHLKQSTTLCYPYPHVIHIHMLSICYPYSHVIHIYLLSIFRYYPHSYVIHIEVLSIFICYLSIFICYPYSLVIHIRMLSIFTVRITSWRPALSNTGLFYSSSILSFCIVVTEETVLMSKWMETQIVRHFSKYSSWPTGWPSWTMTSVCLIVEVVKPQPYNIRRIAQRWICCIYQQTLLCLSLCLLHIRS